MQRRQTVHWRYTHTYPMLWVDDNFSNSPLLTRLHSQPYYTRASEVQILSGKILGRKCKISRLILRLPLTQEYWVGCSQLMTIWVVQVHGEARFSFALVRVFILLLVPHAELHCKFTGMNIKFLCVCVNVSSLKEHAPRTHLNAWPWKWVATWCTVHACRLQSRSPVHSWDLTVNKILNSDC